MPTIERLAQGDTRHAAAWDAFVMACPQATFFHRAGWQRLLEQVFGHRTHYLCAVVDNRITGVLPLAHVKSVLFGNALTSLPFAVYGGVAAADEASASALEAEAQRLAQHAQSAGAAGISSILPPVLYDARGIAPYFEAVAAAAPELPFLSYLFGSARDAVALMRDLGHIPNLAGTKYTGPNMYEMSQLARFRSVGWTVFSGMDEQAALGRMYGAAGCIGSTLNIMPGVYREIYASLARNDTAHALDLQQRANRVTGLLLGMSFAGALREALRLLGFECGRPRLPNLAVPEAQLAALHAGLHESGFAELAAL